MSLASSICIAGYYFELKNKSEYPFAIEAGFEHFMVQNPMSADIRLQFYEGFLQLSLDKLLYRAKNGTQILWEIFAYHSQKLFLVYHPESGLLQQQAFYDAKTRCWKIYAEKSKHEAEDVLYPLAYPMAPLLWYVLSTEEPLLLVHASGVFDGEQGRIFSGFSGVGKSTMAGIWQRNGAEVINDDRLLLKRLHNGKWQMFNTPMIYIDQNKSCELHRIYFPFHNATNSIENLSGAKALATVLAYTIHHGYDAQHLLHHSNLAEKLVNELPISKLGVVPTDAIIDFIRSNE
jgi:hypothetical protein